MVAVSMLVFHQKFQVFQVRKCKYCEDTRGDHEKTVEYISDTIDTAH